MGKLADWITRPFGDQTEGTRPVAEAGQKEAVPVNHELLARQEALVAAREEIGIDHNC